VTKSDLPVPVNAGSVLGLAAAEALPRVLEILAEGHRVRSNIEVAVKAVAVGHGLRMQAVDELERMLDRYLAIMAPDVRDAYFVAVLRLLDGGLYTMPWAGLLGRRT
jgi:hypothetical protein